MRVISWSRGLFGHAGYSCSPLQVRVIRMLHVKHRSRQVLEPHLTSRALHPNSNREVEVDRSGRDRMHRWLAVVPGQAPGSPHPRPVAPGSRSLAPPPRSHPPVGPAAGTPTGKSSGPSHSPRPTSSPPPLGCPDRLSRRRSSVCVGVLAGDVRTATQARRHRPATPPRLDGGPAYQPCYQLSYRAVYGTLYRAVYGVPYRHLYGQAYPPGCTAPTVGRGYGASDSGALPA
jgi:hypothetical protein